MRGSIQRRLPSYCSRQRLLRYFFLPLLTVIFLALTAFLGSEVVVAGGGVEEVSLVRSLQNSGGGGDGSALGGSDSSFDRGSDNGGDAAGTKPKSFNLPWERKGKGGGKGAKESPDAADGDDGGADDSLRSVFLSAEIPTSSTVDSSSTDGGALLKTVLGLGVAPASLSPSALGTCALTEDPSPPITNGIITDSADVGDGNNKGDKGSPPPLAEDDAYEAASDAVELADLFSAVHCIDGETAGMPFVSGEEGSNGASSSGSAEDGSDPAYYASLPEGSQRPPRGPFLGFSNAYGFNIVNRSCFFSNVLYQFPQQFSVFLPDTERNRLLHRQGLLVPPVSLASRPYDGDRRKVKKIVRNSFDYRPNVVFGPVPGRADALLAVLRRRAAALAAVVAANSSSSSKAGAEAEKKRRTTKQMATTVEGLKPLMGYLSLYADCSDAASAASAAAAATFESTAPLRSATDEASVSEAALRLAAAPSHSLRAGFVASPTLGFSAAQAQALGTQRGAYCRLINSVSEHSSGNNRGGGSEANSGGEGSSSSSSHLADRQHPSRIRYDCGIVAYYTPIVAPWNYAHTLFCDLFGLFWAAYDFVFAGVGGDASRPRAQRWHWHVGGGADIVEAALRLTRVGAGGPFDSSSSSASSSQHGGASVNADAAAAIGNDHVPRVWRGAGKKGSATASSWGASLMGLTRALLGFDASSGSGSQKGGGANTKKTKGTSNGGADTVEGSTISPHWSRVTSSVSPSSGLHSVATYPHASEELWRRSRLLLRGRERRHAPMLWEPAGEDSSSSSSSGVFNGVHKVGNALSASLGGDASLASPLNYAPAAARAVAAFADEAVPRPDFAVVATFNHYANAFGLPNKNKAFEMFSRRTHSFASTTVALSDARTTGIDIVPMPAPHQASEGNTNSKKGHGSNAAATEERESVGFRGAVYDRNLRNNTLYRGLLAGIGTKSWSWVTDQYAASGDGHAWYAFRQHLYDTTGALVGGGPRLSDAAVAAIGAKEAEARARKRQRLVAAGKSTAEHDAEDDAATLKKREEDAKGGANTRKGKAALAAQPLRVSICHKKDKRGVANYEETLHYLEKHFAPILSASSSSSSSSDESLPSPFRMDFILEAAVGRSAPKQVEMMDKADVFMCNEGTLATSMFLLGPGSVFISLPLVYHMANLHRMKMPEVGMWWTEPDLLRPDPRKNTGGNIDWFPQSIPWVRTFWYDAVPLNETKIQTPLRGLRNHMPEWNIAVQGPKVARLYEKVLGYLVSQHHPRVAALAAMLNSAVVGAASTAAGGGDRHNGCGDDATAATEQLNLLRRIDFWRNVFEVRKGLKNEAHALRAGPSRHADDTSSHALAASNAANHYYLKPRHPTAAATAAAPSTTASQLIALSPLPALASSSSASSISSATAAATKRRGHYDGADDDEHNFSVNARLCRGILAASPKWSVAFNGVRCLYGMSWLCEFWGATRFKSRVLHPKWEQSGGRCGDPTTTVEGASALLLERRRTGSGAADGSSASVLDGAYAEGLVDPRVAVAPSYASLMRAIGSSSSTSSSSPERLAAIASSPTDLYTDGSLTLADRQNALRLAASSPFLFSSTPDYPRRLRSYLFYNPQRVRGTYDTTDIRLMPIEVSELEAIFGKELMG